MTSFETLGVATLINAAGSNTKLGGALMRAEVVAAMARAASESVAIDELQAAASRVIARHTGAEAGFVTAGAAAGLTLATAACLTGLDPARMERLPRTAGMRDEVIIARDQRCGYDHAIRAAGAVLVEVGMNEVVSGAGCRRSEPWEYEAAVGPSTAAIAYVVRAGVRPTLQQVVEVAHRHRLPVIVDAAAQLPPVANLRRFVELGADLVAFSGGKALRGPQNAGLLCGKRELIAAAILQNLDLDESLDCWAPLPELVPESALTSLPRHGIGRGLKVSKETVVGLLTALELYTPEYVEQQNRCFAARLREIERALAGLAGIALTLRAPDGADAIPELAIRLDAQALGFDAAEASRRLRYGGQPRVYVDETSLADGVLVVRPHNLDEERARAAAARLREVLGARR